MQEQKKDVGVGAEVENDLPIKHTLYTYRYLFRKAGMDQTSLGIKLFTGTTVELKEFDDRIINDPEIESCLKEYVGEFDLNFALTQIVIKTKENKEDEKASC